MYILPGANKSKFPEVRAFMKEVHPNSTLQRLQNEARSLDKIWKEREARKHKSPSRDLMSLVPEKARADCLVQLYFQNFESTYRILHKPTFWREYDIFWKAPQNTTVGFLPILLLTMALVRCMLPEETMSFGSRGSSARTEAISWINACDAWLEEQSQKHRFLEMYQVMCLRTLAATANTFKAKRAYQDAEGLLTYFRSAGMHRDPSLLDERRCTPFQKEMRRRLWATVVEIELQTSLERGLPSTLSAIPTDCNPPLDVNDEDLPVDLNQLPTASSTSRYTDTSFLRLSSRSLPLRVSLCSLVNGPTAHLKHEDVLHLEQQIREALDAIPTWTEPESQQASTLLDLQLRQFLLMVHGSFARQSLSSESRYSRMVCFETSKRILDQHFQCVSTGTFALVFLRGDVFRAALSICHNAFLCTLHPRQCCAPSYIVKLTPVTEDFFFSGAMTSLPSILDIAFKILEEKAMRRGQGLHDYWYLSAARSLVEMKMYPERAASFKLLATERVATLYQRFLGMGSSFQRPPELKLPHLRTNP